VKEYPAPSWLQYGVLGSAQIAIGAAAIFARFALGGAQPLAVAAARLAIAASILLIIAALRQAQGRSIPHDDTRSIPHDDTHRHGEVSNHPERSRGAFVFVAAGIALAIHFATWIWSLEYTSVAISTLLVATTPIWTALYDTFVRKQYLSPLAWVALAAGIAGIVFVVGSTATPPPVPGHQLLGGLLALCGAVAIGAYFLLIREVRSLYGTRAIVTRTYSYAAIVLLIGAVAARQAPPALNNAQAWGGILAMALVSQLLGHTAMNAALRWFTANAVALSTLLEPIIAAVLAFLIFAERLTPAALAGGVLVLISLAVFLREEAAPEPL
jgi:drug/metabolite transporter (DMT)-like permease